MAATSAHSEEIRGAPGPAPGSRPADVRATRLGGESGAELCVVSWENTSEMDDNLFFFICSEADIFLIE